ncbi:fibroblast growth factor receptor-like 1 [Actinia tenebrosa]|uniref:receptor protein-tyrosine kinase n=1 Tax=Actinia tenebrosa TaxID=6105 RepID=A0A6P8I2P8_ACTTE|nr:fibroblast growth factor receptor-like 1 [Actinia tenebrosa]
MCLLKRAVFTVVLLVVSFAVLVQARDAPKFIKTPKKEYTVYQGDTIKLRCSVTGTEDPVHNRTLTAWQKLGGKGNGVVRKSRAWRRFRVKNGRYLRIKNVKLKDSGTYLCMARNPHGAVTAVIKLTVKVSDVPATNSTLSDVTTLRKPTTAVRRAPTFRNDEKIKAFKITTGKKIKLRCQARGVPSPDVQWLKNNKKLDRFTGKYRRRITKWTLSFSRVTPSDSGIYQCLVWNQYGNITKTFIVQVKGRDDGKSFSPAPVQRKPVIQKHLLNNATVTAGELVTFTCRALSSLVPRFTWLKWTTINSTSNETVKITVLNSSYPNVRFIRESSRWSDDKILYCHKLKILNVTESDQGRYTCVVGSIAGFVSSDVYLTVKSKRTNNNKEEKPKTSSSSSQITMGEIQIPIAALIAVPVAFGVILIVTIIWCYIQTVRHRDKFKMNSQPMTFPMTNGAATHTNSNGMYEEMPRTINNGVVMGMTVNRNVYDGRDDARVYQEIGNIPPENANDLYYQTDLQDPSNGETSHDRDEDNNHIISSLDYSLELEEPVDSGKEIQIESNDYLEQSNLELPHYQDHPEDTTNEDCNTINEIDELQDCKEKGSSDKINFIKNSVV